MLTSAELDLAGAWAELGNYHLLQYTNSFDNNMGYRVALAAKKVDSWPYLT